MSNKEMKRYGKLALVLCLGGLILAVAIGVSARLMNYNADVPAYLIFLGFQVAAFVVGILSRREPLGKAAFLTSAILGLGSAVLLA